MFFRFFCSKTRTVMTTTTAAVPSRTNRKIIHSGVEKRRLLSRSPEAVHQACRCLVASSARALSALCSPSFHPMLQPTTHILLELFESAPFFSLLLGDHDRLNRS